MPRAMAVCLSIDGFSRPPTETINFRFGIPARSLASNFVRSRSATEMSAPAAIFLAENRNAFGVIIDAALSTLI
jgi:hypothetical protein